MIEVEKKFRPTEDQLEAILKDSQFVEEIVNNDIIYDYSDYRLLAKCIRLRLRNGKFELKISEGDQDTMSIELEDEEDIKKYFNITSSIKDFVKENLIEAVNIKTKRIKYKKDDFIIDIDELDFGYSCVEVELLVKDKKDVSEANERIIKLAGGYGWEIKEIPSKKKEYFRIVKPDVYNKLYGKR